jgi:ABC-type lipoprotein release transport system permease subunit
MKTKKMILKSGILLGMMFVLATLVLAGCGVLGGGSKKPSESGTPSVSVDDKQFIKVSVSGGNLQRDTLNQIAQLNNVTEAQGYLALTSGGIKILGVDPSSPLIMEVDGKLVTPGVVEGRLLQPDDSGKKVMITGKTFAENNKTGYGYPILGMAAHNPPFYLDDKEMTLLGVYETGSAEANNWIVLPLDTTQQLYGKQGVNLIYITVSDPTNRSSVLDEVKGIVGKKATVH